MLFVLVFFLAKIIGSACGHPWVRPNPHPGRNCDVCWFFSVPLEGDSRPMECVVQGIIETQVLCHNASRRWWFMQCSSRIRTFEGYEPFPCQLSSLICCVLRLLIWHKLLPSLIASRSDKYFQNLVPRTLIFIREAYMSWFRILILSLNTSA